MARPPNFIVAETIAGKIPLDGFAAALYLRAASRAKAQSLQLRPGVLSHFARRDPCLWFQVLNRYDFHFTAVTRVHIPSGIRRILRKLQDNVRE